MQTIQQAYERIVDRAIVCQLTQRLWSLAELGLGTDDYEWLCDWASQLQRQHIQSHLRTRTNDSVFGLVFLLFCSEVARREVHPGTVWAPIRRKLTSECANYLFPNVAPRVIESAARQHRLRHVFDSEGGKNWMITVHLQFGLHHACLDHMSNWLRGFNIPDGMGHLLGRGLPRLTSPGFVDLYNSLKRYRRQLITQNELLRRIADCPWVLEEYKDDLLRTTIQAFQQNEPENNDVPAAQPFLSRALLRFGPAGPEFHTRLVNLDAQPWEGNYAELYAGETRLGRLVRMAGGNWNALDGDSIPLPSHSGTCHVVCRNASGDPLGVAELQLWDSNSLFTLFSNDGCQLAASHQIVPESNYWVLTSAEDLSIEPEPDPWYALGDKFRCYHVCPTGATPLRLLHAGTELWSSVRHTPTQQFTIPAMLSLDDGQSSPCDFPYVKFRLPVGVNLLFARSMGSPLNLSENDSVWTVGPLPCIAGLLPTSTHVYIGFESNGEIRTTTISVANQRLPLTGCIALHRNQWQDCQQIIATTIHEAEKLPFRVFPDLTETGYLFEGAAWVGQFHKDRRSRPYGWGGKLYLHRRLYNLIATTDRVELIQEVTDPGVIYNVNWNSGSLNLELKNTLEFDPDRHMLTVWLPDLSIQTIPAAYQSHWDAPPLAIALSYDGQRIGAWWAENWEQTLEAVNVAESGAVAAFLRWAQLPLLKENSQTALVSLLDRIPGQVLRAWLLDEFLPANLCISDMETGWREVIGTLFHRWNIQPIVTDLLEHIGGEEQDPWVVADRLRIISPVVAARFLQYACPNRAPMPLHNDWGIAPEAELLSQIEQLVDDGLGIDTGMIQHRTLGLRMLARLWRDQPNSLPQYQQLNLTTAAFTLRPFCDLLTLDILEGTL